MQTPHPVNMRFWPFHDANPRIDSPGPLLELSQLQWDLHVADPLTNLDRATQVQRRTLRLVASFGELTRWAPCYAHTKKGQAELGTMLKEVLNFATEFDHELGRNLYLGVFPNHHPGRFPADAEALRGCVAIRIGRLAKAAESLDHLEDIPLRTTIITALDELFVVLCLLANLGGSDIRTLIQTP